MWKCGIKLARVQQGTTETVCDHTLRLSAVTNSFESAVERQTPGRTPWAAFSVVLFHRSLFPSIQCLQLPNKPVSLLREAVGRARRHEVTSVAGVPTVSDCHFLPPSTVSFPHSVRK